MRHAIFNYHLVILIQSIMVCLALAAMTLADHPDYRKCSVDKVRDLIYRACSGKTKAKRSLLDTEGNDAKFIPYINQNDVPEGMTVRVVRRHRSRRGMAENDNTYYFIYCCTNWNVCEGIDCPFLIDD